MSCYYLMGLCKNCVTPEQKQWSYIWLVKTHQFIMKAYKGSFSHVYALYLKNITCCRNAHLIQQNPLKI